MKKRLAQLTGLLLAVGLLFSPPSARAAALPENQTIRIGLAYGSNALPGANLLNAVGAGYRLGCYDENLNFFLLASTAESGISVVKTQNVYYTGLSDGFSGYTDAATSKIGVGCYHIQLPGAYATYDEAKAAAETVTGAFPAWIEGTYRVRVGAYLNGDEARSALSQLWVEGAEIVGTSVYGVSVVKTGTADVLFQFDEGEKLSLAVLPGLDDSVQTQTWFKGSKYFGGFRFERIGGGNLTVVNLLNLEDYVNCVISQEMSNSWPLEALKAQACCARTYANRQLDRHASGHFDLCPSTHCQAYPGCGQIGANTAQAAAETAGSFIWYGDKMAETYYFSSDGGATEDVRNVWSSNANMPYLAGVIDPYEAFVEKQIGNYRWSYNFTPQQLTEKVRNSGRNCADIVDLRVSEFTPSGNVRSITLTDSAGKSWSFYGDNARIFLGVRSLRFTVTSGGGVLYVDGSTDTLSSLSGVSVIGGDGTVTQLTGTDTPYVITSSGTAPLTVAGGSGFTVSGSGWGHNVGMSQWGAYAMAKQGYTYEQILTFYYTGVTIENR